MPIARFEMPDGRIARFEVAEGTTPEQAQAQIQQLIQKQGATSSQSADPMELSQIPGLGGDIVAPTQKERTTGDIIAGAAETGLNLVTGATTGSLGYLAGAVEGVAKRFMEEGFSEQDAMQKAMEYAQKFTYEPKSEAGQDYSQAVGAALDVLPPAIGGAATTPTSMASIKPPKKPSKKEVRKNLLLSSPERQEIKSRSSALYKELDDMGAVINDDSYMNLALDLRETLKKEGHNPKVTKPIEDILNVFEDEVGTPQKVSDIDVLRQVAKSAANSTDPNLQRLGGIIINKVDDFLDSLAPKDLAGDSKAANSGKMYKKARELWSRNKKIETLEDADFRAQLAATGYENGLRQEFTRILKNKKLRRQFSEQELKQMKLVADGDKKGNAAKFFGKFGLSEGRATSMVGSALSGGAGFAAGGPAGAAAAISGGQLSKWLSQRLTKGKTDYADALTRAGKNGEKITEVYLKNTPKAKRNPNDLKELLLAAKVPEEQLLDFRGSTKPDVAKAALLALSVVNDQPAEEDKK